MTFELRSGKWINTPAQYKISDSDIVIYTQPKTDFWQRSYYGFQNDNAPAYLFESTDNFTFSFKTHFDYKKQFDQCGLMAYQDSQNWFKASIEYENTQFSRLGSVVTNHGYSDWATQDISLPSEIWFRLSRRGPDFLIEYALDGQTFKQMRIFHLHQLGETSSEMGKANPPLSTEQILYFGVYACSPNDSSFCAEFSDFQFAPCCWKSHSTS